MALYAYNHYNYDSLYLTYGVNEWLGHTNAIGFYILSAYRYGYTDCDADNDSNSYTDTIANTQSNHHQVFDHVQDRVPYIYTVFNIYTYTNSNQNTNTNLITYQDTVRYADQFSVKVTNNYRNTFTVSNWNTDTNSNTLCYTHIFTNSHAVINGYTYTISDNF
jgi:hypothetical protein